MGARLSPKMEPLMIAPHIRPISIPSSPAKGHITAETAVTALVEVPQAVEISTQTKKAITGIKPVFTFIWATTQIRASINPLVFSRADGPT